MPLAEGKGQIYTPKSIVNLIAEMIEPYKGKICDPCCGSGGMFVQSMKFVETHQENKKDISIYGQEVGAKKSQWAEKISPCMDVSRNQSPSFRYFVEKLRELAEAQ